MRVYLDKDLKHEVKESVLFENEGYFLLFTEAEATEVRKTRHLNSIIELLPLSSVGKIKFQNQVGFITILKQKFDVRSKKLGDISGNEQTKLLITEINSIFRQFTFSYPSATAAARQVDFTSVNADLLSRFDYLRQAILSTARPTFKDSLDAIIHKPHHKLRISKDLVPIHRAKNTDLKELSGSKAKYAQYENDRIQNTSLAKKILRKGKNVFPETVIERSHFETFDTSENRFIKFFLQEISSLAHYIISSYGRAEKIHYDAMLIKSNVDSYLAKDFFRSIGKLTFIPYTSTTLHKSSGYKELFQHFISSRLSFNHLLERINKEFDSTGLNKISYLYEVWCFLKVCSMAFTTHIKVLADSKIYKDGSLSHRFVWAGDTVQIGFNITYSYSTLSSYSLRLKPDISLIKNPGQETEQIHFFDAKYRVDMDVEAVHNENTEQESWYKAGDIHKMHTYLDAIPKASNSFILYPGNKFIYFRKDFLRFTNQDYDVTQGVGAIPAIPGANNPDLETLIRKLL